MDEESLAGIIEKATTISDVKAGQEIFHEGQEANFFYIVLEGRVRISRFSPDGKEIILKEIQVADSFAEVVIFEQDNYPATSTATVD